MSEFPESMLIAWHNKLLIGMYRDGIGHRAYARSKILFAAIERAERELAAIYGPTYQSRDKPSKFDWWRNL